MGDTGVPERMAAAPAAVCVPAATWLFSWLASVGTERRGAEAGKRDCAHRRSGCARIPKPNRGKLLVPLLVTMFTTDAEHVAVLHVVVVRLHFEFLDGVGDGRDGSSRRRDRRY